jgi:hypothetical protein
MYLANKQYEWLYQVGVLGTDTTPRPGKPSHLLDFLCKAFDQLVHLPPINIFSAEVLITT